MPVPLLGRGRSTDVRLLPPRRAQVQAQGGHFGADVDQVVGPAPDPDKGRRADAAAGPGRGLRGGQPARPDLAQEGGPHAHQVVRPVGERALHQRPRARLACLASCASGSSSNAAADVRVLPCSSCAPSHNRCSIYALNGEPLFFQHFEDGFFPTLRLLQRYPDLLPHVKIDRGAIRFLLAVRVPFPSPSCGARAHARSGVAAPARAWLALVRYPPACALARLTLSPLPRPRLTRAQT